jgi:hypothetical protein
MTTKEMTTISSTRSSRLKRKLHQKRLRFRKKKPSEKRWEEY